MRALDDLSHVPGAFRAWKLPIPVSVDFATSDGTLKTKEGAVAYRVGDALLTGSAQERWPVERPRFFETYEAMPGTQAGAPGNYVKRRQVVWCIPVDSPMSVSLGDGRGELHAERGDVIVQYRPGDLAVVGAMIFRETYRRCES